MFLTCCLLLYVVVVKPYHSALAVLYTSSITKTVAVCASLVLTTVMGYVFFEAPLNGPILLGCFVVVLTVFGYRDDCHVDDELGRLRSERWQQPSELS